MWGVVARQYKNASGRFHREELLSGISRSPDPFGTSGRRLRGRGWGNVYGAIAARRLKNRDMISEFPLCNSGGSPCWRRLVRGVGHHDVLAKAAPLPEHFYDCNVPVFRSPRKRRSTAVVRRVGGNITHAQQHPHNIFMPTFGCPRERCSATVVWFVGVDAILSE